MNWGKWLGRAGLALGLTGMIATAAVAQGQQPTLKIAVFEVMSGGFSILGETNSRSIEAGITEFNNQPGQPVRLEMQVFDTKGSTAEAQTALSQAVDQGFRYIAGGGNSAIVAALIEAIARHNERNPGQEILHLNHQATDPTFTNARCSYWHFRFDPHVYMRMEALTRYIAADPNVHQVYLINQDYSAGQQVQASAKEYLAVKRPDIKIVGEELHPIGKVRDFTPFVTKIQASGADTIITQNFGTDLTLLIKAAYDIGLKAKFYTYYANALGAPTALGETAVGHTRVVTGFDLNTLNPRMAAIYKRFKEQNPKLEMFHTAYFDMMPMLAEAVRKAGSTDPRKVAAVLEGLTVEGAYGPITMRAEDHQMLAPLFVQTFSRVDGQEVKVGVEGTAFGFKTEAKYTATELALPTTCTMRRPG